MKHDLCITVLCVLAIAAAMPRADARDATSQAASAMPGCLPAGALTAEMAPPALYGNVVGCWVAGARDDARHSFFLAGTYGRYDAARVGDGTAHQVISVLQMQVGDVLGADAHVMVDAFQKADVPASRAEFCAIAERIGPPAYSPTYMTSHGMDAFTGKVSPTPAEFERVATWNEILRVSAGCASSSTPPAPSRKAPPRAS